MTSSSHKTVRAFIAARPDDAVRAELLRIQRALKQQLAATDLRIRWTDPASFHITLLFLGDIPAEAIGGILQTLEETAADFPIIGPALDGASYFAKTKIVQVGLKVPDELRQLQSALASALGMAPGRFHAHFTLGRIKSGRPGPEFFHTLEKSAVAPLAVAVPALELIESKLLPSGPEYTVLGSAPLK